MVVDDKHYSKLIWTNDCVPKMSQFTREWYLDVQNKITPDRQFLYASPVMLMGMLNAGSTTLGLLAQNYKIDTMVMKVMNLRSSDDSMSTYLADDSKNLKKCVDRCILNLEMIGINMSLDKSFFREGLGEYASWYMEDTFVSQFGEETSALRPQGKIPNDDMYSVAKGTSTALSTFSINALRASARGGEELGSPSWE